MKIYRKENSGIITSSGIYLLILLFFNPLLLSAQDARERVQLIDEQTDSPVTGMHYIYGDARGISDEKGFIYISFNPRWLLALSHVEYGRMEFSPQQVEEMLNDGLLRISGSRPVVLQPITIRAMRKGSLEKGLLSLSDYDRLSHDAGSYLSHTPAVSVIRKSGNYGFDPVLRGFKYEQLNLVIDGVQTAIAACPNRMDPPASQISLNQMERVEILKGPYFLRYGPSFGGTINFVSAQPDFSEEREPFGRFSTSYESNGNILRTEGKAGIRNESYRVDVNGSWSGGGDYRDGDDREVPSSFGRGSFGTNMVFRVSGNQDLGFSITRNLARDVDFAALPMDLREDNTWLFNARHQADIQGRKLTRWSTTGFITHVKHLMDNLGKDLDPRTVNAITDAMTLSYGGRTEATFNYASAQVFLGADFRMEEAEGLRTREMLMGPMAGTIFEDNVWQNGHISKTGFFGEYKISTTPVEYVFSGRLEINNAGAGDVSDEFFDVYTQTASTQFNPSLSAGLNTELSEMITLGFWLGRSMRSGSLSERYINYFPVGQDPFELIGNPDLKPEVNNQMDLNIAYRKGGLNVHLDLFASYLQDFISSEIRDDVNPRLPMSPGVKQFINIDRALLTGFEVSWQQYLPAHLTMDVGIAYTYGKDLEREDPLPEIAPLDLQIGISGHLFSNTLRPEIRFRHAIRQNRISGIFGETETPGFNVVDIKATYDLSKVFHLAAGVKNLFDATYYEHLNRSVRDVIQRPIYAPGRNLFFTITVDLMN